MVNSARKKLFSNSFKTQRFGLSKKGSCPAAPSLPQSLKSPAHMRAYSFSHSKTERTGAETATHSQNGGTTNVLDMSADADLFKRGGSVDPNLLDLDPVINNQKIVGSVESKLLLEKRLKRIELLQQSLSRSAMNHTGVLEYRQTKSSFN